MMAAISSTGAGKRGFHSKLSFFFSSRRRHTRCSRDWSSDVCSSDLMSGGDPLLLSDRRIAELCGRLRAIPHLEVIRIGSRVPCHLPERITPELCGILKQYHPLYINTHFNHPDELTPAAVAALRRLADAGVPLGCQTVLLKGRNDDPEIMKRLMQKLL